MAVSVAVLEAKGPRLAKRPGSWKQRGSDLEFACPTIPTPDAAGGPFGTAAVDDSEVTFDESTGAWQVSNRMFETADAMDASNEMFWTFSGTAFPAVEPLGAGGP